MRHVLIGVAGLAVLLTGCSAWIGQVTGTGPPPQDYFDGADADLAGAIRARDEGRIAALIDQGADVEATGRHGMTMLEYAVQVDSLPGITALLQAGADPDRTGYGEDAALHLATGNPPLMAALLDGGADPDVENATTKQTPLNHACLALSPESFEVLVAAGADLNHQDWSGELALHTCASTNQGGIILRMLDLGVDPMAPASGGGTFQDVYFSYPPPEVLNDRAVEERRRIVSWLVDHGYPLVPAAERYR